MNSNTSNQPITYSLKNKKVVLYGFAKTGQSTARYLAQQGAQLIIMDSRSRSEFSEPLKELEAHILQAEFGRPQEKLLTSADLIILSPGIPRALPEVQAALSAGVPVINDIELVASQIKAPIIAITGTNGKTTVTSLITAMLKAAGKSVFTGGNIGTPICEYFLSGQKYDVAVIEVSSFQAESLVSFQPQTLVLTNLEPDHLDRYPSADAYYSAKKRLLSKATSQTQLVLNLDNPPSLRWTEGFPGKVHLFTKRNPQELKMRDGSPLMDKFQGAYLDKGGIHLRLGKQNSIFEATTMALPGLHNKENIMAAATAAFLHGASVAHLEGAVKGFPGVPHRIEFIRRKDGVLFYNDSKGTNVASVVRSLQAFQNPIILIAGGRDKDQDFSPLVDLVNTKVKTLILLGEAKEKMNRALGDYTETYLVGTFEEAVLLGFQKSRNGDIILFSPACASYDMFKNYEERGDTFRQLVQKL